MKWRRSSLDAIEEGASSYVHDVRTGRFERSLSRLAAVGALVSKPYRRGFSVQCVSPLPITFAEHVLAHGIPVPRFSYSQCDNDRQLMRAAAETVEVILTAAGAEEVITVERYAHLVGGARMGDQPETGVVDRDLRSFAVPNLWVTDGSTLPTQGAANPALTIMALAARAADLMIGRSRAGLRPACAAT